MITYLKKYKTLIDKLEADFGEIELEIYRNCLYFIADFEVVHRIYI